MGGVFNHINSNLYHYGANNPVRYIDPTGRNSEDDLAAELGNTTKSKGVDLNLFSSNNEDDLVDTDQNGNKIYMHDVANKACRYNALFYVSAHGGRGIVSAWNINGNNGKSYLSPKELAELIMKNANYRGQPVVLWICNCGKDPLNKIHDWDCYAKQLAEILKTTVIASQEFVSYKSSEHTIIRPNGRELIYRIYNVYPGKEFTFRGEKK